MMNQLGFDSMKFEKAKGCWKMLCVVTLLCQGSEASTQNASAAIVGIIKSLIGHFDLDPNRVFDTLIFPIVELDIKYFDLGLPHRDATDDKVTVETIKCATITPDEARMKEFTLKQMWKSPNGTIRNILNVRLLENQLFAKMSSAHPCNNSCYCFRGGQSLYALEGMHLEINTKQPITLIKGRKTQVEGKDEKMELEVYNFTGAGGVALSMYNTDESIQAFAEASMNIAYQKKWPLLS
ncbi:hypothetical protein LOK49_LG07G00679 [Camellia lanceoleosa]|uniref:Uncharacterized protein n=1 Tax=Camellia lanceoleosa TaxID=1840588 RepID=A0ACC0H5P1_9ERIC|nr:hypothetical protein LOK49_LG07G00679 [Camellia lanceoleosa]